MTIANISKVLIAAAAMLLFAGMGLADTLELKDGRVLQGRYLGGTQTILRFEVNGDVQTFPTRDIVALTFTRGGRRGAEPAPPGNPPPDNPPQGNPPNDPPQGPPPQGYSGGAFTLPAGQPVMIRMIDSVDSSKNHVGDIFHASLETDLNVNGVLVARKGSDVYGRLASAEQGGKFSGKSELQLELTRLVIDGRDYPVVSSDYNLQGKGRGGDTAKKVGGGAVLGAIIGGIAAGGKGAAIGAAAGGGAGAGVQILTKGQQVKVPSETLLEFRLQQPATVTPTGQ
ncbi:MAG TPA: hypothetical protein VM781_02255 [Candidatus Bathyarchaeia archaeon]|nr:hypothetical protein [Candidatus Bathyarchaeia archaeon]